MALSPASSLFSLVERSDSETSDRQSSLNKCTSVCYTKEAATIKHFNRKFAVSNIFLS